MDAGRFDAIAKSLTAVTSRRQNLVGLLGAALGVLEMSDPKIVTAGGKCKKPCGECQRCKKGTCRKSKHGKVCKKGKCRPTSDGTACGSGGQICAGGSCGCPSGSILCGAACVRGTCCPDTACGAGSCRCVLAIEGDTFCSSNQFMCIHGECATSGTCGGGLRCAQIAAAGNTCCISECGTV